MANDNLFMLGLTLLDPTKATEPLLIAMASERTDIAEAIERVYADGCPCSFVLTQNIEHTDTVKIELAKKGNRVYVKSASVDVQKNEQIKGERTTAGVRQYVDERTYSHTPNSAREEIQLVSARGVHIGGTQISDSVAFPFGGLLSLIYGCAPVIQHIISLPIEESIDIHVEELGKQLCDESEKRIFDSILKRWIIHEHNKQDFIGRGLPLLTFGDVINYVNICVEDTSFCSIEQLSLFCGIAYSRLELPTRFMFSEEKSEELLSRQSRTKDAIKQKMNLLAAHTDYINDKLDLTEKHLPETCLSLLYMIFSDSKVVRVCEHCGKLFVPENKADTKYCNNRSPQYKNKSCSEAAAYIKQLELLATDRVAKRRKSAYNNIKNKRDSRDLDKAVYEAYDRHLKAFQGIYKEKRKQFGLGQLSEDELILWIDSMSKWRYGDGYNENPHQ